MRLDQFKKDRIELLRQPRTGKTGWIVPKNNVTLFVEKLLLLIEDDTERTRLSKNGWIFVKTKFHYSTLVKNMDEYYQLLLNKKKNK